MKYKYYYQLAIVFLALILTIIFFSQMTIMGGGESGLPFYNVARIYQNINTAWSGLALGNTIASSTAGIPIFWFLTRLQLLGVPDYLIQASYFLLVFVVTGLSVFSLSKLLFPKTRDKYHFLAVVFYWFNPISTINVWNRFLNNYMLFWALLPLTAYLLLKGIKEKDLRYAILISLSTVVFSFALTSPVFIMLLWLVIGLIITFKLFFSLDKIFLIKYFLLILTTFTFFNFWWLGQLFAFTTSPTYDVAVENFFDPGGNIATMHTLSERLGKFIHTFRFSSEEFYINGPVWARYFNILPVRLIEYSIIATIIFAVLKNKRNINTLMFFFLFLVSLYLIKGSNTPYGEIFTYFFERIPALQIFRNPFEKFGVLLILFSAPLLSLGISHLSKKTGVLRLLLYVNLLVLFVWSIPFFTKTVFSSHAGYRGIIDREYDVKVPDYYNNANMWLKNNTHGERTLVLPIGGEGITYTWDVPYAGVELSNTLFETPVISFNSTIPYYNTFVSHLSLNQINEDLFNYLPYLNIKYILIRTDIEYKYRKLASQNTIHQKADQWEELGIINKVFEEENITIYELDSRFVWPKIYFADHKLRSNSSDVNIAAKYTSDFPQTKPILLNKDQSDIIASEILIPETKFHYSNTHQLALMEKGDEDIVAYFFYVNHLPDKVYYPLIRIKENISSPPKSNYTDWRIYHNGILGKRAVEVYRLISKKADEKRIKDAEQDYVDKLNENMVFIKHSFKESNALSELIRNSLLYQQELFRRSSSPLYYELVSLLIENNLYPKFDLPEEEEFIINRFLVSSAGYYDVRVPAANYIYLNGKLIKPDEYSFQFLETGTQELSYHLDNIKTTINLSENEILMDDKIIKEFNISFPDTQEKYMLKFDYLFQIGRRFKLEIIKDIDYEGDVNRSELIIKDELAHGWRQYGIEFSNTIGAKNATIKISPHERENCEWVFIIKRCVAEVDPYVVTIRNIKLESISYPDIALLKRDENISQTPSQDESQVVYEKVDSTKYLLHVIKNNPEPEVLVFSELFNPGWKAKYKDGDVIPDDSHNLVNAYANSWLIDRTGDYEITLEFAPQRKLENDKHISTTSIILGIVLLGILTIKKKYYENN
jgi:hypothetical protein